jgi:hypothetical protein
MPTPTYTLIDSVTLTSSASSVTFSSISATGKGDLVLVVDASVSDSSSYSRLRFNSDSGSNYPMVNMSGNGSAAASSSNASNNNVNMNYQFGLSNSSAFFAKAEILDYSATNKHKSVLVRNGQSGTATEARAVRWANNAAITEMALTLSPGTYAIGSTFHLYQIVSEAL